MLQSVRHWLSVDDTKVSVTRSAEIGETPSILVAEDIACPHCGSRMNMFHVEKLHELDV